MDYRIIYPDAFPVIEFRFCRGESIKAESDAMIAMSDTIDVEGKMEGGFLGGLKRKVLTGESFFLQRLVATRGNGKVIIGHSLPGGIQDIKLDGSTGIIVQKGGFLAATESVDIDMKTQSISRGLFSNEGFFLVHLKGSGNVFISSYGGIHPIRLNAGNDIIIDNGHLVAWTDTMSYSMEKSSNGWISSLTSGEGLVCRFKGPGMVYIQTRNPQSFSEWINSMIPRR